MLSAVHVIVILCALSFGRGVPVDEVKVSVQPPVFRPGQTSAVTINCTFFKTRGSNFLSVNSLSLVDPSTSDVLIAKIDVFHPQTNVQDPGVTASGDINGAMGGYLTVMWSSPSIQHSQDFKCVVEGVTNGGVGVAIDSRATLVLGTATAAPVTARVTTRPVTSAVTSSPFVGAGQPNIDQLQKIIAYQSTVIYDLQSRCAPLSPVTNAPGTLAPGTLAPVTNAHVTRPPVTAAPVTAAPTSPLVSHQSQLYLGHRYLLSQPVLTNFTAGQQLCTSLGGYLAEIADQAEYSHVTSFLASANIREQVYVGINYNRASNAFYHSYSFTPVTYFQWDQLSHQPHPEGGRDCVVVIPDNNMSMASTVCFSTNYNRRYLCEV